MAEPTKDKSSLTDRLEEDRLRMAVEVNELKKEYDLVSRIKASVKKEPWGWVLGALLTGFLISRLPARRKKVYIPIDSFERKETRNRAFSRSKKGKERAIRSVWSLIKPIITAYIGKEIYQRATANHNLA